MALGCWLEEMSVSFVLRLPKSTTVKLNEHCEFERLDELLQYPGFSSFEVQVQVTKQTGFGRFNLATRWKRVYRANQANQVWYLLTNLDTLELALKHYAARFSIEAMFKDFKSGGLVVQKTFLSPSRTYVLQPQAS